MPDLLDLPPGPRQPPTAQALQWIMRPREFAARQRERFGDVFTINFDGEGIVFLGDPEDVRTIFTGGAEVMHAGEANAPLEPVVGARSILLLDEADHLRERRLMLPPFHGERMRRYAEIMNEAAERDVATWEAGAELTLLPHMQSITLEVIMRAIFGIQEGLQMERLGRLIRRMLRLTTNPSQFVISLVLGPDSPRLEARLRAALDPLDAELYRVIAEHRESPDLAEREDILAMLMLARDEHGEPMSDRELRDELMTLLLAGHETTANTLSWAFERVTRHPEILARVAAEARAGGDAPYTEAVIQETLRLRPVLPLVVRKITKPVTVGQGRFRLPVGTRVAPAIILIHYREDIYPEPDAFRPERFLESPPGTYTWLPFGGGMRRCLGASFAQFEMKAVLQTVLSEVELEPVGAAERVGRRGFTLVPNRGGRVRVVRRLPSPERRRGDALVAA
jgi:cytochrome P450 family 135